MSRSSSSVAFPRSYQRHLVTEQRKAVLAAIRDRIGPEHTVGEVLDAAEALGWGEPMNELSLADLAAALLAPIGDAATAETERQPEVAAPHEDEAEDEAEDDHELATDDEDEDDEDEAPVARGRGSKKAGKKKTAAKTGKKKAASKAKAAAPAKTARGKKAPAAKAAGKAARGSAAKASASSTTARGKKTGRGRKPAKVDFDEPMSLDEAAAVLVPLVKSLGEATMQDLEEQTAGGRRKLRFHIGQLVREGYLVRHGMGRGTFYTVG